MIPHAHIFILVFGFIAVILVQAWFVRRTSNLRTTLRDRQESLEQLTNDLVTMTADVAGFGRALESNAVTITGLERETEEIVSRIEVFRQEHGLPQPAASEAKGATDG